MVRLLYIILTGIWLFSPVWAAKEDYAAASVLAEGKWVKIRVAQTGVYKLTYSELQKMGFDPQKVSVHGYGGWPLDEFSGSYPDDLPATPVWRGTDYLLFYAKGPVKWKYDQQADSDNKNSKTFVHTNNPYSQYGYYFITDHTPLKEMETVAPAEGASLKITTFDDYFLWEKELVSVNSSGRELYGESFDTSLSRDFSVSIPGITADPGYVTLNFIAKPISRQGRVSLSIDGSELITKSIATNTEEYGMANSVYSIRSWSGDKNEKLKVTIQYNQRGDENVRLNYFRLQMKRILQPYGACTFFRSLSSLNNPSRFVIQNATSSMMVWEVTEGTEPKRMESELNGSELSFSIPASGFLREFALVQPAQLPQPEVIGVVENQNLHASEQQDMIILARPALVSQAERLAEAHRTRDHLKVKVVTPEAVYNEFSSGTPDATAIRRFMKMFYDRQTSEEDAPKYLLLFGDGSYDNRQLTAEWKKMDMSNMLLTYQTKNSINEFSFVADDFFGFLNDNCSNASDERFYANKIDIGIGRFPVRTVTEATQAVDKVLAYMENQAFGLWKNQVCFVADDGNSADSFDLVHVQDADKLAGYVEASHPEYLVNKLYFDAYKKTITGGRTGYPDVEKNLMKTLKDGVLLINYTGHGDTESWSDERVLKHTDITQFSYPYLPLWITATCDFTRFDDLNTSAGEDVFLNAKSGGIALFTTTRVAYAGPNFNINDQLIRNTFQKKNGRHLTLGEIIKETKRNLSSSTIKNRILGFSLIGDPALSLSYPEYKIRVTTVNGKNVEEETVKIKALQKVTVEGVVVSPDGTPATDFSASLRMIVKDSKVSMNTLDNNGKGRKFTYTDYPNTLFMGNDSVRAGTFRFTFTVPKDILYSDDFGKMNLYAFDEKLGEEAQGTFQNFRVGETDDDAEPDTDGPEIKSLYLNDSTFVEGGKVNATPYFVARVWDKSGINISGSSVGHDMMLIVDGLPTQSYNLNHYYEILPGGEGEGIVRFSVPELAPGLHTAEFWVWDILNNSTLHTFTFEVVEGLKPSIMHLTATPSPAREQVQFSLYHNRPESKLKVGIMVYDLTGRLQWKHEEQGVSDASNAYTVTWDLTNNRGGRLRPGVYIYRAAVSTGNSKEATEAKKLIILGW